MQLNRQLFNADENEIFTLTGCLSQCDKYAYNIQPTGGMQYMCEGDGEEWQRILDFDRNSLRLLLYFSKAEHELREQVNKCLSYEE